MQRDGCKAKEKWQDDSVDGCSEYCETESRKTKKKAKVELETSKRN